MPHLWIRQPDAWAVLPLDRSPLRVEEVARVAGATLPPTLGEAALVRTGQPGRATWHLIAPAGAEPAPAVNGLPLATGLRTLADRDELRLEGVGSVFYSTERLAAVEPMPANEQVVPCPRCRDPIAPGSPAVRCPGCELWHHQSEERPCWTYAPTCALCPQGTGEDAGYRWTPEE